MHASECRITEPDTGAADGVSVETTASVSVGGGAPVVLASYDAPFIVPRGSDVVVTVDNVLARDAGVDPELAASGAEVEAPAIAGLAALALGLLLTVAARPRRSRR
jgi:hypothetical protein